MNSRQIIFAKLFYWSIFVSMPMHAAPITPTDPDTVIAHWPATQARANPGLKSASPLDEPAALAEANRYLSLANRPGQSRLYGLAQASVQPFIAKNHANTDTWLVWAQIQQHLHNFDAALSALTQVTNRDPHNNTANLLAARIYLIQGKNLQARHACMGLLGHSDLLTASGCLLEVTSQEPQKLADSYAELHKLVMREGLPADERGPWLAQLLADMAMRLGDYKIAAQWLSPQLPNASINLLAQWAQTQLLLGNYQALTDYLAPLVTAAAEPDDALLLPLALAEIATANVNTSNNHWQTQLSERVALREQRQDRQHANELARYFLEVNPQPQKAVYWAQLHYQESREASDKQLLERALAAANKNLPGAVQ